MSSDDFLKNWLKALGIVVISLLLLLVVGTFIHEMGHALMARILGIPFNELEFGWHGLGPGVTVPETTTQEQLVYYRYAGGFFAAFIFLVVYALYLYIKREKIFLSRWWSISLWWLAYPLLLTATFNLTLGIVEGGYFGRYVMGELPTRGHYLLVLLVPLFLHMVITILLVWRKRVADTQ